MNMYIAGTMNPLSGYPGIATGTPMYMTGSVIGNGTSNVPQQQQMMMPQQLGYPMQQQQMMMPQQQQVVLEPIIDSTSGFGNPKYYEQQQKIQQGLLVPSSQAGMLMSVAPQQPQMMMPQQPQMMMPQQPQMMMPQQQPQMMMPQQPQMMMPQQQQMMMPQQPQMMMPQQQPMMMPQQQQQMMMPQQQQPDLDTYLIALAKQFLSSTGVSDTSNNSQNNNFLGRLGVSGGASNTIPLNDLLLDSDSVDEDSSEESTGFW